MVAQPIPIWFVCGFFLTRRECSGFTTTTTTVIPGVSTSTATAYSYTSSPPRYSRHHDDPCSPLLCASSLLPSGKPARAAALAATVAAATGGGGRGAARATALYAKGFGSPPAGPNPRAYYPAGDDDDDDDDGNDDRDNGHTAGTTTTTTTGGGGDGQPPPPSFPDFAEARKVEEPKGIGTLFERGDEVIRELSSEEYLDVLRDWAPLASFASKEALDPAIRKEAVSIRTVLRGMAEWQPKRNSDFTKLGSKWSFGAPIGAIKGGQVDAMACLQVSEEGGVVIEWICGNPTTLGVPGNAVDWLAKGVSVLCGKRLDLPVAISGRARGEGGADDDESGSPGKGKGATGGGRRQEGGGSKKKKSGGGGGGGSKKRR